MRKKRLIRHVRDSHNQGWATIVAYGPNEIGVSYRSKNDSYNKAEGVKIAEGRAACPRTVNKFDISTEKRPMDRILDHKIYCNPAPDTKIRDELGLLGYVDPAAHFYMCPLRLVMQAEIHLMRQRAAKYFKKEIAEEFKELIKKEEDETTE